MAPPFGFINAFKPVGISSAAFGNWVKRVSHAGAVGHWGTLDPAACGVLVLAIGRATRLLPLMPHARKQYIFQLVVGSKTDSGDSTGRILLTAPVPRGWQTRLPLALQALLGVIQQTPPMHSALKVDGRPLYRSARLGADVPRAPRAVNVYALRVLADVGAKSSPEATSARLLVECDAGTYVRVLCEDIGREIGLPAHMGKLVRVAAGNFQLRDSVLPSQLERDIQAAISDPLTALQQARLEVDGRTAQRFIHGNEIVAPRAQASADETLVMHNGRLLGSGHTFMRDGRIMIAPVRVLAYPSELA